jgi:hypothetical protein
MSLAAAISADFVLPPYLHQLEEFEISSDMECRALFWNMRTGKTKVVIDTACHLYKEGKIDAVCIIAPNGVHENWIRRELPRHLWRNSMKHRALYWDTKVAGEAGGNSYGEIKRFRWEQERLDWWAKARELLDAKDFLPWFALASDTMTRKDVRRLATRITKRRKKVLIVFDESHDFRTPGAKRTAMARALAKRCAFRRILSGTPVENSPLHSWSQFELLEPGALGFSTYGDFKDHHAVYVERKTKGGRKYSALDHYKNLKKLRERMAKFTSVVLRSDCEDLPDLVHETREIELTERQKRIYAKLLKEFKVELRKGLLVSIGAKTQKLIKLQQVTSGFLKDEYGALHRIPGGNPKLDALVEEVRLAGGKCIVWCAFREDMDQSVKALRKAGFKVLEYHGRTNAIEKRKVREAFAPESKYEVDVLVGHPKSGGQGLDLSAARKIIWFSHTFDAIIRGQADERATMVGGKNIPIIDLVAPGVDRYILQNILKKTSVADALTREGMKKALRRLSL